MKKEYVYITCAILLIYVLSGCNRAVQFDREMDEVERLLVVSPDSAWKVLMKIDPNEPRHEERKARYALLYTQVQDKNNMKIENDSIISIALKYYEKNGTVEDRFLSLYYYGKFLSEKGDFVKSLSYFSKAESLAESISEPDYKKCLNEQISILYNREQNISNILLSQHDYMLDEIKDNNETIKNDKKATAIWIVVAVVLCGLLLFNLYEQLQLKKDNLDSYLGAINELRASLNDKNSKMSELKRILLKDNNRTLNLIGASFFDKENTPQGQKLLYREVQSIIERFRQKKTQQELELFVNKYCDDVMIKLREEIPDFEEEEYIQVCYHIVGFSSKLISLILGISVVNINTRKFRLKKRIETSNACCKNEILQYL